MKLTDWRGNDYQEGDTIIFARGIGQTIEMCEGVVLEIREVEQRYGRGTAFKVKVLPLSRGSRYARQNYKVIWLDPDGNPTPYAYDAWKEGKLTYSKEYAPVKPVTLSVVQNITKL